MGKTHLLLEGSPKQFPSFSLAYSQARPWARVRTAVVRGLLVFLAAWLLAASLSMLAPQRAVVERHQPRNAKYVLVIDSGSSGTRIYAYNWTMPPIVQPGTLPVVQAVPPAAAAHLIPKRKKAGLYNRVETQPGLDAFVGNPASLSTEALEPLLAWARAVIPMQQHASTPLFLMGTGGFRRMDHVAAEQLLQGIRSILRRSGFRFHDSWARVISGTQEGIYGWLALNYQQGLLQQALESMVPATALHFGRSRASTQHQHPAELALRTAHNTTSSLGALDMGGSSLELTLEVAAVSQNLSAAAAFQNVTLGDRTYHLHTHTFQHYGLNEVYDRTVTLLYEQQHGGAAQRQDEQQASSHQHQGTVTGADSASPPPHDGGAGAASALPGEDSNHETISSISSNGTVGGTTAQQQRQVIASASAAGLQMPDPSLPEQQSTPANSSSIAAALLEQHRQADLAIAAAAGLHPRPSAAAIAAEQMQADAAVAAAAGMLSVANSMHHKAAPIPDSDFAASSSMSEQQPHSNTASIGSSNVIIGPGMHRAEQHEAGLAGSPNAGSQSAGVEPIYLQPASTSSDNSTTSEAVRKSGQATLLGSHEQQLYAGVVVSPAAEASVLRSTGRSLQSRSLLQYISRKQRQHQRRLALQAQADELLSSELGFGSSLAEELEPLLLLQPSDSVVALESDCQQRHGTQPTASASRLQPVASYIAASDTEAEFVGGARQLLARDMPVFHSAPTSSEKLNGMGRTSVPGVSAVPAASAQHLSVQSSGPRNSADAPAPAAPVVIDTRQLPVVGHPCLHEGFAAPYVRTAYNGNAPQPPKVLLEGQPSWTSCLQLVDKVVNATASCHATALRPVCRLGTAQPELQGRFLAMTGFYIVQKFLGVPSGASLDDVLQAANKLCLRPWSWMQHNMGQQINAERYCTWGPYTVKLLKEGLLLKDSAVLVGSGDVGWTLGAALSEASKLPDMMRQPAAAKGHTKAAAADPSLRERMAARQANTAPEVSVQDYLQHSSWAQQLWGSQKRMHMGHMSAILVCIVAWLSVVLCCLPSKQQGAGMGVAASWHQQAHSKGSGRAAVSPVLPLAGHHLGRNSPNTFRSGSVNGWEFVGTWS